MHPMLTWSERGEVHQARWRSENRAPPPARVVLGDERLSVTEALGIVQSGAAILWRGDFQKARQLLIDLGKSVKPSPAPALESVGAAFEHHRRAQAERATTLGLLLIPFEKDGSVPLRRAPDVRLPCEEAYPDLLSGDAEPFVTSLRELLGLIGAHEWRKKGVPVPALGANVHPHYGVFSPVRGEYVALVANAPLPFGCSRAFDIGTGTGVLAAVLSRRGVRSVIATDSDPRAVACAHENFLRLGLRGAEVVQTDLYPRGKASLVVCNPPWLPGEPTSALEGAIYDPGSIMLRRFLDGLGEHLDTDGEGWLILSDFAELLGLRAPGELGDLIQAAGLKVVGKRETRPAHGKVSDTSDPLHAARAAEVTSLWRLKAGGRSLPPTPW